MNDQTGDPHSDDAVTAVTDRTSIQKPTENATAPQRPLSPEEQEAGQPRGQKAPSINKSLMVLFVLSLLFAFSYWMSTREFCENCGWRLAKLHIGSVLHAYPPPKSARITVALCGECVALADRVIERRRAHIESGESKGHYLQSIWSTVSLVGFVVASFGTFMVFSKWPTKRRPERAATVS